MDKFCLFDIESDDEEEKMLNSVLNKIDNELKEIYPSYLTKLASAVHFEKIESNTGCSKFNYNAGDNGYVVNDSEDSFTSEPYDKSEREEKKESDATIIKDLDDEMGVTAETFITFFCSFWNDTWSLDLTIKNILNIIFIPFLIIFNRFKGAQIQIVCPPPPDMD